MAEQNPRPPPASPCPLQNHGHDLEDEKYNMPKGSESHMPKRALCSCITIFLLLAGITLLVLWFVYRPHKPRFTVVGAAVYGLNATAPPYLTTSLQFTLLIRNPNRRLSIYFDRLSAVVLYRNEAITAPMMLPPLYMKRRSMVSVSPMIGGSPVAVSAEIANGLAADESYGVVGVRVVVQGRLRWKAGAIRTGHYGVYVKCDLLMGLKKGFVGQVPLLAASPCVVDF
ncbi:NDR1/HIN1-like protein 12 [Prosopis cineraria]|uniref:NDR1/HIN1-like protein 12 n=1 Tax=Prosopis cineraria TaxID=364024 RepID=UPI00240EB9E3|nr:NDR1/HIN1-like protein 12 [Prosopis cineraria]